MNDEKDKIIELTKPSCKSQNIDRLLDLLEKDIEQHTRMLIVLS